MDTKDEVVYKGTIGKLFENNVYIVLDIWRLLWQENVVVKVVAKRNNFCYNVIT